MGKILKPVLQFAAVAVNFIPGIGQIASLALTAGLSLAAGAIKTGGGSSSLSPFDPKSVNPDPVAPRKLVFGQTTFPLDLRYAEPSGTNDEYVDYIFALAAHKSTSVTTIYIENDLAWTSTGGAQGKYAGYLTVEVILEAGASNFHTVNAGTRWGSSTRMTGCTTMKVRVKRSDNSKSSQSPFASGIAGRWAVMGTGIPVYDPARDSTVAGGSGTQRANDQSTWLYTASSVVRGNNPALQLLTYLLGWRINNVLSVGCGLPADVLDLPSFATAAAICDESVALAAGGSQRRYEAGRPFSDADDPMAVIAELLKAMNGELVDDGGRLALRLAVNDLTPAVTLTDADFVGGYDWQPSPPLEQQYTVVRGRYAEPAAPSLYGMVDYPQVGISRTSLVPRALSLELSAVQEQRRAQRIATQAARRSLYMGTFTVTLGVRGWLLRRNMVVAVTSSARGWTAKLFRVRSLTFNDNATVDVVLREENAVIYSWSANESAVVAPITPVVFDSRKAASWLMAGIEAQANLTAPNAANRVPFSLMEGDTGWFIHFNPSSRPTLEFFGTPESRRVFLAQINASAAGQQLAFKSLPFKVTAGERTSVQAYFGTENTGAAASTSNLAVRYTDDTGAFLSFGVVSALSGAVGWRTNLLQAFLDVPAGAVYATLNGFVQSGGAGIIDVVISEPMVASAVAGQTVHPLFTPGPNAADGADVTRDTLPALQRGAWSSASVAYALGDIVTRNGSSYVCIFTHTSTGSNGPPGANWALLADKGDQGPTGVSAPPIKALGAGGAAQFEPIRLEPSQTLTVAAELFLNTGGVAGVCSMEVQISIHAANSWAAMTGGTDSDSQPTSEPVELAVTGATFTNSSGAAQLYDVRMVSVRQSRSVNQELSNMRVL